MKIAAFNIKKLGWRKLQNKVVLRYLIKILSRYSVVLILEVVDKTGGAMTWFLNELNQTRANKQHPYSMARSSRLGRDTYKEQFVFLYRENEVQLKDCYQYEDNQPGDEDALAREPYILRFSCQTTVVKDLVLIPVHTKPEDSVKELDVLDYVVQAVMKKWRTNNIMILGDFNADGHYISKRKMGTIRIRSDPNYHWLIGDDVDTTACNCNDHTYDRIVVYGETMLKAVFPNSAKPFNFQKAYSLADKEALSISDHYPVEVRLRSSTPRKTSVQRATKKRKKPNPSKEIGASGGQTYVSAPIKRYAAPTPQRKSALGGPEKNGPQKKKDPPKRQQKNQQSAPKRKARMPSSSTSQTETKRGRLGK